MNTSQLSERGSVANTQLEALVDERAVAKFYGVSLATVRRWRWLKAGPRFIKVPESSVRYRPEDLKAYLNSRTFGGGHQAEAVDG
jgi:predicted DNA-binding transcriptional regulator AlpA